MVAAQAWPAGQGGSGERARAQVGNFRVEPPGLFRGRGEHPRMGQIKRRIFPRDITINIGKPLGTGRAGPRASWWVEGGWWVGGGRARGRYRP